jgi:hypothetical protein
MATTRHVGNIRSKIIENQRSLIMHRSIRRNAVRALAVGLAYARNRNRMRHVNRAEGNMNVNFNSNSRRVSLVGCQRHDLRRSCPGGIARRGGIGPRREPFRLLARSALCFACSRRADTWRSRQSVGRTFLRLRLVPWPRPLLRSAALHLL